jgi:tRNA threonylcarbamoyladenosine biosynthesis protein TsaE
MQNVQTKSWKNCALADLPKVASELLSLFSSPTFFAIEGDMGAGKTTFVQVLLKSLGISEPDGSPTYAIVHEYRLSNGPDIYHLDCYRIENERDLAQLGLDELFEQNAFFFVEWPQKIEKILPDNAKWLYIRCAPESELREIVLTYDN